MFTWYPEADEQIGSVLERYAKLNPAHEATLLSKARYQEHKRDVIKNRTEFMRLIQAVDDVLTEVELHLKDNDGTKPKI